MDEPQDLIESLSLLGEALDDPFDDLNAVLDVLTDDLVAAVPGYVGLTLAVQVGEQPIAINTLNLADAEDVKATLMLPLPLPPANHDGITCSVVFASRTTGAFIHLAGDVRLMFTLDGPAVLDAHLPSAGPPAGSVGVRGLTALCTVNQAIGVLVTDGFTLPAARGELHRRRPPAPVRPCPRPHTSYYATSAHQGAAPNLNPGSLEAAVADAIAREAAPRARHTG